MSDVDRSIKAATAAGHETDPILNQGLVTFRMTDANADYAGTIILKMSIDGKGSYETVWQQVVAAGDDPIYKTIYSSELDAYYVLEADVWTAGTGITLTLSTSYRPGV